MSETYNLKSIMDIVRKIPEDRIDDCLDELCQLVKKTSGMWAKTKKLCADNDIEFSEDLVKLPDAIDWTDDDLGEIRAEVKIAQDESISVTVKSKI